MSQYEYRQRWRKITAEVNILAESSGNSNDETELSFVEHSDPVDQVSIDSVLSSTEKVSSSSDSELDLVDLNEECIGAVAGIDNDGVSSISEELASWATKNNCRRDAMNELLKILRRHGHDSLPKDARTLLQTPRQVLAVNKCGGQYIYLGIAKGIMNVLSSNPSLEAGQLGPLTNSAHSNSAQFRSQLGPYAILTFDQLVFLRNCLANSFSFLCFLFSRQIVSQKQSFYCMSHHNT